MNKHQLQCLKLCVNECVPRCSPRIQRTEQTQKQHKNRVTTNSALFSTHQSYVTKCLFHLNMDFKLFPVSKHLHLPYILSAVLLKLRLHGNRTDRETVPHLVSALVNCNQPSHVTRTPPFPLHAHQHDVKATNKWIQRQTQATEMSRNSIQSIESRVPTGLKAAQKATGQNSLHLQ